MQQIVSNISLQKELDEFGFFTMPFLDAPEIKELLTAYNKLTKNEKSGFHASMFDLDESYRKLVHNEIIRIVSNKVLSHLIGYEPLFANFMVKEPGEDSGMKVHQDWTYVDESHHTSLAIWIPLIDLSHKNGGLYLLPGSNKILNKVRGPGIPCPYDMLHDEIRERYGELIPLKAGEAVVWNHRVVHYSPPNLSNEKRIAATVILVPKDVPIYHYYRDSKDTINHVEQFQVDTDFYMKYAIGSRPENAKSLGFIDYEFAMLNEEDIKNLKPTSKKAGVLNKIKSVFSS